MQNYTLTISEDNKKTSALINYLKTLDFIKITKATDWWDELSTEDKKSVQQGLDDIENNNIHSDEDVKKSIKKHIFNIQNQQF